MNNPWTMNLALYQIRKYINDPSYFGSMYVLDNCLLFTNGEKGSYKWYGQNHIEKVCDNDAMLLVKQAII